ncbi:restriction endonuclease subunit S [uncultured Acinetobacter sp.]|uniref:restriction endonuclease subunit S n=1 Tax=uncultured Acinetobacter sp. TaxID=165433 RepID=UPI00258BB583|nr:restriction endonuclease subunit S [uncultured Acinetobacter sp.]
MVPNGWSEGKVSDLLLGLESGVSVNGTEREIGDNEKAVLKVSAVSYGTFDPLALKVIEDVQELSRAKVNPKAGQIIISRSNTENLVGASAYIDQNYPNLFLPDKLWQTISKPNTEMKWLSYVLASEHARYTLSKLATGTSGSMKNITQGELLSLKISIPPYLEQKKIAQTLSTWNQAISATKKLLENTQQQKKALMQQLLTGKKRLLDENGVSFSDTWKTYKLGQLFKERVEMGRDDLPLLSITADDGVVYQEETGRKNTSNEDKSKYRRICVDDIGYNTMRMWQGRSSLSDKDGIVSPAYTIIIPSEKIVPRFAAYLFKLPKLVHVFYRHSQGLVSDTWNLKFSHFKEINWSFPCVKEQRKIAEVLLIADQEIDTLQKKLDCLKQEKKALMQQLLTGKKRVKVAA